MELKLAVVATLLLFLSQGSCDDNITVNDLPPGAAVELVSMVNQAPMKSVISLCQDPKEKDIELLLYTRKNIISPINLDPTNPSEIDPTKKVILVIHGWIAGPDAYGIPNLRDAYLQRYDCNLIVVNWKKLAWQSYPTSCCYLPKIGRMVANFLCNVNHALNISLNDVHLVGHSLGGQMSGFIGQNTMQQCKQKVGRITAMDPAGPLFQGLAPSERLDSSDAAFVDVIHTNAGFLGYYGNCGDADFYVNCGAIQPGCIVTGPTLEEILNMPVSVVACNHLRSLDYMAESVNSKQFLAHTCTKCPLPCLPTLSQTKKVIMGEDCPINTEVNGYLLLTKRQSPFAMG